MAGETPIATPAPVEAAVAAPAPTPVAVETASAITPPVDAVSIPDAPVVETPVEAPKPAETVLGEALKPVDKTAEAKTPETDKPADGEVKAGADAEKPEGQSDEPAPPPVYEPFVVPEGISLDTERFAEITNVLSELEAKGVDHAFAQEYGQKLVNMGAEVVNKALKDQTAYYTGLWDRQKTDWKDLFLKDPEIGGNRFKTTVDSALTFIRTHGGTDEQQAELRGLMDSSGLGNHPAILRLFSKAGVAMSEGKPLAAQAPAAVKKSKVETFYGKQNSA